MAVQGSDRKFNICDRCFASVPLAQAFCLECGAPIVTEEHRSESSDAAVYTELARANLLRMRGEYKQAEEQCLNILKRFPNNASANTLLGDISAELNDLAQAVQWYELSLDLVPNDDAVKGKLNGVKERISIHEAAMTAQQLGLPATGTSKMRFILMIAIPIVVLASAAFIFGTKQGVKQAQQQIVTPTVRVPAQGGAVQAPIVGDDAGVQPNLDLNTQSGGESALLKKLTGVAADGPKVLAVMRDPRTNSLTIAYQAGEGDFRALGARLARSAFDIEPDALVATVRAMRGGALIFTADVLRARLNDTTTNAWQRQNQDDPQAWVEYVLTNPWGSTSTKPDQGPAKGLEVPVKDQTEKAPEAGKEAPTTVQGAPKDNPEPGKAEGEASKDGTGKGGGN